MSYYRNYRRPYYYRRRRYRSDYNRPLELIKGIVAIGVALILFSSLSSIFTSYRPGMIFSVFMSGLIFVAAVWMFRMLKHRPEANTPNVVISLTDTQDKAQIAEINSEKHGCKCYMDGLTVGEQEVASVLSKGLNYKDYFLFNNLTIPSDYNGSSQIDHLVVSRFGIFVIESKDYQGWIFGSKDNEQWTQSLPGGTHKFRFQNPIRQNWSHIMSLRALVPFIPEDAFQSIVAFLNSSEFKTPPIENVVSIEDLIGCIEKYSEDKILERDLHLVLGKLSYVCQTADISSSQHIENLNTYHSRQAILSQ